MAGIYFFSQPKPTTLQSKASSDITKHFYIMDANGKEVICIEEDGVPVCEIETLDFSIGVKDPVDLAQENF